MIPLSACNVRICTLPWSGYRQQMACREIEWNIYIHIYIYRYIVYRYEKDVSKHLVVISICFGLLGVAEVLANASGFKPRGLQDPKCTEHVTWIYAVRHLRSSERVGLTFAFVSREERYDDEPSLW